MPEPLVPDSAASNEFERSRYPVLGEAVLRTARRLPHHIALRCDGNAVTYAQLVDRALRLGDALQARGVEPGDRVAILMHNRIEIVESFLACHLIGACAVPINFRLAPAEVAFQLDHCSARVLLVDAELEPTAALAAATSSLTTLSLSGSYQRAVAEANSANLPVVREDDLAFLIYTSGTTGRPKGAMLTHRNLMANTHNWIMAVGATADDVWLSGLPLFHIGGINGVLPFLLLGGTAIIMPSTAFNAEHAIALLDEFDVTMSFFVPTQWQQICDAVSAPLERLRIAMWGGSQCPIDTLRALHSTLPGVGVINAFGQTEMSSNTCMLMPSDALRKIGSVGMPIRGVEARVVDDEMHDVADGEVGEIVYRGPTVMAGYLGDPTATAEAFRGGWFHSGDLVRRDGDGYLYVVDRRTDMIVSGGENIYPAEVERVLLEHPQIRDAAVVGVPHPHWVQTPVAVVVCRDHGGDTAPTADGVITWVRERLASYKKPQAVVFVDEMPRNAAGKVLRRELRERYRDHFTNSPCVEAREIHQPGQRDARQVNEVGEP